VSLVDEVREARSWTQEKLSECVGYQQKFSERGRKQGQKTSAWDMLLRIAQALGTTVQYLATGEGEEPIVRKPIMIPVELSQAAEELHLSHQETLDLLGAYNSVVCASKQALQGSRVRERLEGIAQRA